MNEKIEAGLARRILQRMGETGQPPERGALKVNVGTEEILDILRDEYLRPIREAGINSTFKLVQAPFGGGKTQFLHCLRETAWKEGFHVALVGVSPTACPFDRLEDIYRAIARKVEAPPANDLEEAELGIGDILRAEVDKRLALCDANALRKWLDEEVARARISSHSFRRATVLFMKAALDGDFERESLLEDYLRGGDVPRSELQPLGLREVLEEKNAFRFLKSLIQALKLLDVPGLVLLFDEIDRVMSLTARRRRSIADNIREMIDCCGQSELPGLVFVYAVPPEFMTNLVPEYPALEQRLQGARRFSSLSPLSPIIDLDQLPLEPGELLRQIGLRLLDLHQSAFGERLDEGMQRSNVEALAADLAASQLESGTRRTFVKSVIGMLGEQMRGEERLLSDVEIRGLTQHEESPMPELAGEEIF